MIMTAFPTTANLQRCGLPSLNVALNDDLPLRGMLILVGATMAMALGFGTLALTSVFMRPLEAEFGWSRAELSFAYAVATVGMAVGGLVWGRVSDRVNIRLLMAIGGSGMVLS